ncbi:hypothetical protein H9P43_002543 [Blastocladiella emersonii ATCC 22665]|nr:hypothetical protein H9P43_002543 [Blastocladiella emersonii ATCC 22665]
MSASTSSKQGGLPRGLFGWADGADEWAASAFEASSSSSSSSAARQQPPWHRAPPPPPNPDLERAWTAFAAPRASASASSTSADTLDADAAWNAAWQANLSASSTRSDNASARVREVGSRIDDQLYAAADSWTAAASASSWDWRADAGLAAQLPVAPDVADAITRRGAARLAMLARHLAGPEAPPRVEEDAVPPS